MHVDIYGMAGCGYCSKAIELCAKNDIPFSYYDIGQNIEHMKELSARVATFKTVPQIFIGDDHIGGYTQLEEHLND